ncbi:unnamed protein product [Boreogadus saida]
MAHTGTIRDRPSGRGLSDPEEPSTKPQGGGGPAVGRSVTMAMLPMTRGRPLTSAQAYKHIVSSCLPRTSAAGPWPAPPGGGPLAFRVSANWLCSQAGAAEASLYRHSLLWVSLLGDMRG